MHTKQSIQFASSWSCPAASIVSNLLSSVVLLPRTFGYRVASVSASRTAIQRRDTCTFEHVYLPVLKFDCFFFLRVPLARGVHVSAVGQNKRDFPPCSHPVPPCVLPTQSFARIENDSSSSERHSEPNSYVAPFPSRLCTIHFIVPHQSSSRIRHGIHKYKP
jgi:hypothetical protein